LETELHLVHVGQLPIFLMKKIDTIGFDRILYEQIEREAWLVKAAGGPVAGAHLRMGVVAEEIVGLARDLEADLIVMGSRGHSGIRRAIDGSISDAVARRAHCLVMTVRTERGEKLKGFWRRVFSSGSTNSG
jgi:nucleotide-binding universal stress UspA family protein